MVKIHLLNEAWTYQYDTLKSFSDMTPALIATNPRDIFVVVFYLYGSAFSSGDICFLFLFFLFLEKLNKIQTLGKLHSQFSGFYPEVMSENFLSLHLN